MSEQTPSPPPAPAEAPIDPLFSHAASPFIRTEAPTPVAFLSPPDAPPMLVSTYTAYRSQINFGLVTLAYLMVMVGSVTIVEANPAADWRFLAAALPVVPAVLLVWMVVRALARLDEVQKRMQMQALGFSMAGTGLGTFAYGFLEGAGLPHLNGTLILPLMTLLWGLGVVVLGIRQRYRF
jgi:hypothetical protein